MLRVVLVDDEQNAIITLQSYIEKYIEDVEVVGVANSKKQAIELLNTTDFDLLTLDINLGDGTGFQVLEEIESTNFNVIFSTAYDEHAIKAFKYSALDYLLKPLNPKEFIDAVERSKNTVIAGQQEQISLASDLVKFNEVKKIVVNSTSEIQFIAIENIIRLESDKNYTDIYLTTGEKITSSKTLKHYDSLLQDVSFFRVHQKHLVNMACIKKFIKEDGGYVEMIDNTMLGVSRRKKEELLDKMMQA